MESRAAGGACEQINHQPRGIVAGVGDHVAHRALQFVAFRDQVPLQPLLNGDGIEQLHHAGRIENPVLVPGSPGALTRLRCSVVVPHPGDRQAVAQPRATVGIEPIEGRLKPSRHCGIGTVERHSDSIGPWRR